MACHARLHPTVYANQGPCGMPRLTSSVRVWCVRTMKACHAQHSSTVRAARWQWLHAQHRPTDVLPKGNDKMPCLMTTNRICFPLVMIVCHARLHLTVCAAQGGNGMPGPTCPTMCAAKGPWVHATPYVVLSCVLSKVDNNMPCQTSSDRVCFLWVMMACHTQRRPIVYAAQGQC
ncbi:hypothetical protein EJD97_017963 [Solanum chilense]|uniref:Uncharacterized protein n=1 Tax=Solanum chilense TaxID=4083 RepID=A0A6N2B1X2_SOLCI|nr:hypothetical protein EJD97_017963 [Solanum chilense]